MYREEDFIQVAPEGSSFGRYNNYKYRVMSRDLIHPNHHTDSLEDAKQWFNQCREYWVEQDELST